jgi:predicted Zn-dependent protease
MTDRPSWQTAFLKQARVDWEAYQRTRQKPWPECHRLLFLQMASEKLGKALLVAGHSSLEKITQTHAAFVKFMQIAGNHRKLQKALGMKKSQQRTQFKTLKFF